MTDGIIAIVWLTVNILIGLAAWNAAGRLYCDAAGQRIASTIVFFWGFVVSDVLLLSALHFLTTAGLIGTGLFFSILSMVSLVVTRSRPRSILHLSKIMNFAWALLACLYIGRVVTEGLLTFPTDFDSLAYHIPIVDDWLRAGSLFIPNSPLWYNPSNNEILALWLVGPFSGDYFIGLNNLPACILLASGTWVLASELGVRQSLAHLSAFAVVSTQVFCRQIVDNENDVAVAGLFLVCLAFGARFAHTERGGDVAVSAVALGLLSGVKYYAIGYAGVAAVGTFFLVLMICGWRAVTRLTVIGLAGLLILGGYWYARNFILTNTPFYPFGLTSSTDRLEEYYPGSWSTTFIGSDRFEVIPLGLQAVAAVAGPFQLLAVVSLPILLVWLIGSGVFTCYRSSKLQGGWRLWLAGVTVGAGFVLFVTPYAVETDPGTLDQLRGKYLPVRFGQCFLGTAIVALAVVIEDIMQIISTRGNPFMNRWLNRLIIVSLIGVVGYQLLMVSEGKIIGSVPLFEPCLIGVILFTAGIAFLVAFPTGRCGMIVGGFLLLGLLVAVFVGTLALSDRWNEGFISHYDGHFDSRTFSALSRLPVENQRMCVMQYQYYPFFGPHRNVNIFRPERIPTSSWLMAYLRDNKIDIVVIMQIDPYTVSRYHNVKTWLHEHPDIFDLFWQDVCFMVFLVNQNRLMTRYPLSPGTLCWTFPEARIMSE